MAKTKLQSGLDKRFEKVLQTPASFDFFVAIHDFVEYIEANASLLSSLSDRLKPNRELKIPTKYENLKRIYQGLEDANHPSNVDLGHARYAVLLELNRIRKNDVSDSNSFWKKREAWRKISTEIYQRLNPEQVA